MMGIARLALVMVSACGLGVVGIGAEPVGQDAGSDASTPTPTPTLDAGEPDAHVTDPLDAGCDANVCPTLLLSFPEADKIRGVTVEGGRLFFIRRITNESYDVVRANVSDGGDQTVLFRDDVRQIAVRGDVIVYTPGPKRFAGGIQPYTAFTDLSGCVDIDPSSDKVLVADFGSERILQVALNDTNGGQVLFDKATNGVIRPWGVLGRGDDVVFTLSGTPDGQLRRLPRIAGGSANPTTMVDKQSNANCIVADKQGRLYWSNAGSGELMRANADGSGPIALVTGQGTDGVTFTQIGIDDSFVYWSAENRIFRLGL